MPQLTFPGLLTNTQPQTFPLDLQNFTADYERGEQTRFDFVRAAVRNDTNAYRPNLDDLELTLNASGAFEKPADWTGRRASPGQMQQALSRIHLARAAALGTLSAHEGLKRKLDRSLESFEAGQAAFEDLLESDRDRAVVRARLESVIFAGKMAGLYVDTFRRNLDHTRELELAVLPMSQIVGFAVGAT